MADICGVSFGACLVRVTRVDANGNVIAGDNAEIDSPGNNNNPFGQCHDASLFTKPLRPGNAAVLFLTRPTHFRYLA